MEEKIYLGVEFGSTRIKAVGIDDNFRSVLTGDYTWKSDCVEGVWTYPMEKVWEGLRQATAPFKGKKIEAVGVSAMMHGYLAFDKDWNLLVPFRTWQNTMTAPAAKELSELFNFNIPQRWSIAHLYQAILNGEDHLPQIAHITTLAGYVHFRLTGVNAVGIGEASGIFPVDSATGDYNKAMMADYNRLGAAHGFNTPIRELLPDILVAGDKASISEVLSSFVSAFFPLMTPVIIIGGMMSGVFTPTEAAVVAIVYALILCIVYRTLTWRDFIEVLARTVKQTVPVVLVVAAANIFAWILSRERIPSIVLSFFSSYIHNKVGMLLMINLFLLIVGCFLDPPVAIPIITPVLLPLVMAYNVDIVHFGVIMVLNLMIGLLTPPIGMILFVLSSVASVPFERVVKAVIPYIICLLISLMLVTFWPQMVMLIPNLVFG